MPQQEAIAACLKNLARGNRRRLSRTEADQVVARILRAGARYDYYKTGKAEWLDYKTRRERLGGIGSCANQLQDLLRQLDAITKDDLAIRLGPDRLEAVAAYLESLKVESERLATHIQRRGRPKDLAMERWVGEMADIYQRAFDTPPTIWGRRNPGRFYRLLELSRPDSFPVHGGLALSQVRKVLNERVNE